MDAERDALVILYRTTNGDSWRNKQGWCTDAPLSEWHGVKVSDGRIVELDLGANNLQGEAILVLSDRCRAIVVQIGIAAIYCCCSKNATALRLLPGEYWCLVLSGLC